MNFGRNGNADPRWVLPFLCRRGNVTRQEIGRIQVQERETRFEVAPWAAERFAAAARRPAAEAKDAHIRILPCRGAAGRYAAAALRRPPARPCAAPGRAAAPASLDRSAPAGDSRR